MKFKNIFNFLIMLSSLVKKILSGSELIADFKDIEYRLQICRLCEFKSGDALKDMKCMACECRVKYKVRLVSSVCPEGKWDSTDS